jgi:hypothetical protein
MRVRHPQETASRQPQRIDREHRNGGKRGDMLPSARELIELATSRMLDRE